MILTQENYYSQEANMEFMSMSTFKNFLTNPMRALADIKGEYPWFEDDKALLVGNFLHSYFESPEAHAQFIEENKAAIVNKTGKNAGKYKDDFQRAQKMIERLEKEPQFVSDLANTEREVIVTGTLRSVTEDGEFFDVNWKGKIDALDVENGMFYDFKTVRSLVEDGRAWDPVNKQYLNFIKLRKYHLQMAVYAELLQQQYGKEFTPVIWAVSKDKEPLAKPYLITRDTLNYGLEEVKSKQIEVVAYRDEAIDAPLYNDTSNFYNYAHRVAGYDEYKEI